MTRPHEERTHRSPTAPYQGFIGFLSTAYLVFMVAYLFLRLVFGDNLWWLALLNAFTVYTFIPAFVLLALTVLMGMWREVVRLAIIAILGTIWFGPFFQANAIPAATGPTLTIATFNIQGSVNTRLDEVEIWLKDNDFDVVVLQEVTAAFIETHLPALEATYPYQVTRDRTLLSRHPILELETVLNGQQRVVIEFEGQQIAIYHVHLPYPLAGPPRIDLPILGFISRYDETPRNTQIDQLLTVIEDERLPYIVAGDLNLSQHSIIYGSLAVEMDDSFRMTSAGLGATWPVDGTAPFPLLRLDYVWYAPETLRAVASDIGPELGSDHAPYMTELALELTPAPGSDTGDE